MAFTISTVEQASRLLQAELGPLVELVSSGSEDRATCEPIRADSKEAAVAAVNHAMDSAAQLNPYFCIGDCAFNFVATQEGEDWIAFALVFRGEPD
ncbi:MAG: hypothetical protein ACYTEG_10260 [Planctomycetota bacterium]|jgi:hypothetical protein